jgi:tetratricopeptide (TPR) repeat protein
MSDSKEETTVDHNEPETNNEEVVEESKPRQPIDPSLEGLQLFYEKNKKMVNYVGGGLLVLVAAAVFFKFFYLPDLEKEAVNEAFWAQAFFERDSFNVALNGGPVVMGSEGQKQMLGFSQIAENYGLTKTGNLANYYAGICCLRSKQYEKGIEFLQKYSGSDPVIAPIAIGATGDCYMEMNNVDEAIKFYLKAAEKDNNTFTTPFYLKKAGFAYEQKGNYEEAINSYERIKREFGQSEQGKEIDRDIARVKAISGK